MGDDTKIYSMKQMITMAHGKAKLKLSLYRLVEALELVCLKKHGEYGRERCSNCLLVAKVRKDFPKETD